MVDPCGMGTSSHTERQDINAAAGGVLPPHATTLLGVFKPGASGSHVPMSAGQEGAAAYAGCYKGKVGPCHGVVLQKNKAKGGEVSGASWGPDPA